MTLVNVMNSQKTIITIDTNKEKNWKSKYLHAGTGLPFEGVKVESMPDVVLDKTIEGEDDLEIARAKYLAKFGKKAHWKKKLETILEELNK